MDWGRGRKESIGVNFHTVKLHAVLTDRQRWNFINPAASRADSNVDRCIQTTALRISYELVIVACVHAFIFTLLTTACTVEVF